MNRQVKLMIDTNVFDYIYDNNLFAKVNYFLDDINISAYITHIQWAEIDGICNTSRKFGIRKMVQSLSIETIPTSITVAGTHREKSEKENCKSPGFQSSQVGTFTVPDIDTRQSAEWSKIQGTKSGRNLIGKYSADVIILFTAIKRDMDYVITYDKNMEIRTKVLKGITKTSSSKLKVIDISKKDLIGFLKELP